jgi:hypothetical protein
MSFMVVAPGNKCRVGMAGSYPGSKSIVVKAHVTSVVEGEATDQKVKVNMCSHSVSMYSRMKLKRATN